MRYIKDIPNPQFKIGLYQWNSKYIIKVESGMYEQTYKIDDYEIQELPELEQCIDNDFISAVSRRFDAMHDDFSDTLKRNNVVF
ncbi:hypothetical protein [Dyadobacter luticola]|uniref:Uncharacterized protein n=1 Tax=Dyadobacter luticola TaxID=1979387 RepID=A0A5R9L319_9BACT|nr:hypothetical protein [Dyadobacter luticola]TLV02974.1 hypothetical protein FEN17_05005 [Dyadobacter luticola]